MVEWWNSDKRGKPKTFCMHYSVSSTKFFFFWSRCRLASRSLYYRGTMIPGLRLKNSFYNLFYFGVDLRYFGACTSGWGWSNVCEECTFLFILPGFTNANIAYIDRYSSFGISKRIEQVLCSGYFVHLNAISLELARQYKSSYKLQVRLCFL